MDAIGRVRDRADAQAAQSWSQSVLLLQRSPLTRGFAATVQQNNRFFRRLAGLRGGDVTKK